MLFRLLEQLDKKWTKLSDLQLPPLSTVIEGGMKKSTQITRQDLWCNQHLSFPFEFTVKKISQLLSVLLQLIWKKWLTLKLALKKKKQKTKQIRNPTKFAF